MEGLYKKVVRGIYPKINMDIFSEDIAAVVKSLLQVNPELRPSCADILANAEVKQYADLLCPEDIVTPRRGNQVDLLKTIRLPKKMLFLGGRLPKAQYDDPDKILEEEELDDEEMN
jgi:NIMA (never in mitosis gene a)-related kinase 1/4/5